MTSSGYYDENPNEDDANDFVDVVKFKELDKWDKRFLRLAQHIAQWSKDPSTKVGAVIIGFDREIRSTGFNGFPPGVEETEERLQRPKKYQFTAHAEANAVAFAAMNGVKIRDCTIFVTFPPCADCTKTLLRAGIKDIFALLPPKDYPLNGEWTESWRVASEMIEEASGSLLKVSDWEKAGKTTSKLKSKKRKKSKKG